ncbi:hypothetical protein C8R46DRAFT_1187371 [Mycena filopes]|nr:hypothetical protein C8R46DRAFT_1187371 [Mycena filopes]
MPLTDITSDVSLEIIAYLPLSTISILTVVRKAWKELVDANEQKVYRSAGALHGFISSADTSLDDALASLDFPAATFEIQGWKRFCQIKLTVERNWTGVGPSKMSKMEALGDNLHYRKVIASAGLSIVASSRGGIAVSDGLETLWALPPDYLHGPTVFAYHQGYLAFLHWVPGVSIIDVWHDTSSRNVLSKASGHQRVGAEASALLYGEPGLGHFVPCYALPTPPNDTGILLEKSVKVYFPTLVAVTKTSLHLHMWDVSTGKYVRAISVAGEVDRHSMRIAGVGLSHDFVLAYDATQLRVFSRHDGNFLYHFSKSTAFLPMPPPAVQLCPPRSGATAGQADDAVLLQQVLFRKHRKWTCPRGELTQVGLSECGTTLVVVVQNNRLFIIHDLKRMIEESLPIEEVSFELKMAKEYGEPRRMSPAVTGDRIAIGTFRGILVLTLDRSKPGPAPTGSMRLEGSRAVGPVQLAASFINLGWQNRDSNLQIADTKLFFDAGPQTHVDRPITRENGKRSGRIDRQPWLEDAAPEEPQDDALFDQFDDMPDLQSVSNSSDEGEDEDEESDWSDLDEDSEPSGSHPRDGPYSMSDFDSDDDNVPVLAQNHPVGLLGQLANPQAANVQGANVGTQPPANANVAHGVNLNSIVAVAIGALPAGLQHNFLLPMPPAPPMPLSGFVVDTAPESEASASREALDLRR